MLLSTPPFFSECEYRVSNGFRHVFTAEKSDRKVILGITRAVLFIAIVIMMAPNALAQTNPVMGYQLCHFQHNGQYYWTWVECPNSAYNVNYSGWCPENHRIGGQRYDHIHFPDSGFPYWDDNRSVWVSQAMADAGWDRIVLGSLFFPYGYRISSANFATNCHNYAMEKASPCIASGVNGAGVVMAYGGIQWVTPPVVDGFLTDSYYSHSYKIADVGPPINTIPQQWGTQYRREKRDSSGVYFLPHTYFYFPYPPPGYFILNTQYITGNNEP